MQIGKHKRTFTVEPLQYPVPTQSKEEAKPEASPEPPFIPVHRRHA